MHPDYTFSQQDLLYPVYCVKCRTHIPRTVSASGAGICPVCISASAPAPKPPIDPTVQMQATPVAAPAAPISNPPITSGTGSTSAIITTGVFCTALIAALIIMAMMYIPKRIAEEEQKIAKQQAVAAMDHQIQQEEETARHWDASAPGVFEQSGLNRADMLAVLQLYNKAQNDPFGVHDAKTILGWYMETVH